MLSREDYQKSERKNSSKKKVGYIVAGVVAILLVAGGAIGYSHYQKISAAESAAQVAKQKKEAKFNKTHFNPSVTIDGVNVGKLTVKEATDKVNGKANNTVVLRNGKISETRDESVTTIDKDQVQKYFDKQHTKLTSSEKYNYNNTDLDIGKKKFKQLSKATLTYKIASKSYKLPFNTYITEANYSKGKFSFPETGKLDSYLKQINAKVSTLGKSYKVTVPSGSRVTVKNGNYGWGIDTDKTIKAILKAYQNGDSTLEGKNYLYGQGFDTTGTGYGKSNHGLDDSYVVVSIADQDLWVVKHGKVAVHIYDVVTGTEAASSDGTSDATPKGVWYIFYKHTNETLTGTNDDGSAYSSKVDYWMPFTETGCGLHDASWRTDWSSTAYLDGGSHGCVNIRPSEIKSVWDAVETGMPVIVY